MLKASANVYGDHVRNTISKNLFGHFTEHASDIIYDGIYAPGNEKSDEDGFREDVLDAIKASGASTLRYPGGNFVSNYHWEDGIGPKEKRPKVFDYAWLTEDDNRFGTVEFINLCRKVGAEPYICVNMGSGTASEAMNWVEFCNGTTDSKYANLRRSLGYEEPFNVKYWGLGNEMYGDWQFGACDALSYAKKAKDFAKAMKWVDPSIELIAAGYDLDSDWNSTVAKVLGPLINHIAIHHYSVGYGVFDDNDYAQCMYIPEYLTKLTKACYSSIIAGTNDPLTNIKVSWDEWNTYAWNLKDEDDDSKYNLSNAILTASIMHSFIRQSDIIEIASYSPFINKCGAVRTRKDGILLRSQYYVFKMLSEAFKECNEYINIRVDGPQYSLPEVIDFSNRLPEPKFSLDEKPIRRLVATPYIDCIAAISKDKKHFTLSIINKHENEDIELDLNVFGLNLNFENVYCTYLFDEDIKAANTNDGPIRVIPQSDNVSLIDGRMLVKKHSLTIARFGIK